MQSEGNRGKGEILLGWGVTGLLACLGQVTQTVGTAPGWGGRMG